MAWVKVVLVLQLAGLLMGSLSSNADAADETDMLGSISMPPAAPPMQIMPHSKGVAVEGVVSCLLCKMQGRRPLPNAAPLPGVVAKLQCKWTNHRVSTYGKATTDSKGYFLIIVPKLKPRTMRMCKVVLSLPKKCNKPVFPYASAQRLFFERVEKIGYSYYGLFSAGFFEYAPPRPLLCHRKP